MLFRSDGLEDIYIGGTLSKPGQLYLQNAAGDFINKKKMPLNNIQDLLMALFYFLIAMPTEIKTC